MMKKALRRFLLFPMAPEFTGRKLLIATRHGKERVIAPLLEKTLGVECIVNQAFDTDTLGTFSGEIERTDSPRVTARKKAEAALRFARLDLAIASEGTFGPHPQLFFATVNHELLLLVDLKNKLEIAGQEMTSETNFNEAMVRTEKELFEFARKALFPSHGLLLRPTENNYSHLVKGIVDPDTLRQHWKFFEEKYGSAYVSTDMRAMHNPSRMTVIEKAAHNLLEAIGSRCPDCHMPGFVVKKNRAGVPCELCRFPTRSILSQVYVCDHCACSKEVPLPDRKPFEDPMYCDRCNP